MRQLDLPDAKAEVDFCDACGGMWIDWFDGEVRAVATETLRISDPGPAPAGSEPKVATATPRNEATAVGACPRCSPTRQLAAERYAMTAEVASRRVDGRISMVAGMTGAELLRCEECLGSFVSRASADVLSWLSEHDPDDAPPIPAAAAVPPVPWERFVGVVRSLLGLTAGTASPAKRDAKPAAPAKEKTSEPGTKKPKPTPKPKPKKD
jgi:hypothetical protein